ncbi:MAG: hypothetical protein HKN14_05130 [Marinicaulis sp.]|nr:hypothetical protein [Marinicaulis sp.]
MTSVQFSVGIYAEPRHSDIGQRGSEETLPLFSTSSINGFGYAAALAAMRHISPRARVEGLMLIR